jgi:acetyl esterase/lipase
MPDVPAFERRRSMCEGKCECGRPMTFQEAETRLREMVKGEYCAVSYERITHSDGHKTATCTVYFHGGEWLRGKTFEEALGKLAESLGIRQYEIPDQAPTAEDMEAV